MRFWIVLLALCLGAASAAEPQRNLEIAPASTDKRVALVIGNAAYPGAGVLRNPANDARDFAAKLKKLGFDVTVRTDMQYRDMLRALTAFGEKVTSGTEALFFYAGHGMQVRGKNYLIPIDAEIRNESSVSSEAVDVDQLLDKLSPARLSMVILDACRNNPFERRFRGGGQGLAQINAPTGTLIAYATAPGKVAADGDGRNGLYTAELLLAMDVRGIKIEDVFKRVRSNVVKKSGDAQTPWESSSLTGDFYFHPGDVGVASTASQRLEPIDTSSVEIAFWESIKNSTDAEDYQSYLDKYPNGQFVSLAERRLNKKSPKTKETIASPTSPGPPGTVFRDCADCPDMVVISAGTFQMGGSNLDNEKPVHTVTIANAFALGKTEVTQGQWKAVMGSDSPNHIKCESNDCPVDNVSWSSAQEYLQRLSSKTGKRYRLPSEAEWEYACRAGGQQEYCGSDNIDSVAWYTPGWLAKITRHPVATKQANAWGLYDMSGSVGEWVEDVWHGNYIGAPSDGSAWQGVGSEHVQRGKSCCSPEAVRAAARSGCGAFGARYNCNEGFRPARMLP